MTQHTPAATFSLTINRTINAPREKVFEAWTDPEQLRRWWGVAEGWTAVIAEVDLRVGGTYRLGMLEPGKDHRYVAAGVYREILPPEKLVFTFAWERTPHDTSDWIPSETLVSIEFLDRGDSTELVLTHDQFPDENMKNEHNEGWNGVLASLDRYCITV